ncbi:unnamed protein product [Cladocopium goreaui]|uniref:RRM domain-containing protein n=1 Tax=Cladocopium goreaui TaxID=2562237 RepID=A0A9P1FKA2_9DINO|nr:unnamed protein product [Cladocopium goreaui]
MPHGNRKAKQDPKKKRDRHLKRAAAKNGEQTSRRERLRLSDGVIPRDENTIHLAQLPKAVSKHDVKAMLELAFGKVTHVHLDRTLKFGFARFEEEKSKSAAIQMGTVEFLDERVEMRCGRKGRKEKPETAPEPHPDDKKDDNSDLAREAAENAGRSTATTSTGDEARQERCTHTQ